MESKKYYTPSIEEFHVGFEYEVQIKDVWIKSCFIEHMVATKDSINICRVKCLDQQDIEALGWWYDPNSEPIPNRKELPVFEGYIFDAQKENDKCWILYLFSDGIVWIDYIYKCGGEGYIFKGTIRNKSELKKVMDMVGVATDNTLLE